MTLAHVAHRHSRTRATMIHAVSRPSRPRRAQRVETHAARHGWTLRVIDAGEFDDPRYRANPVDRCYFCKTNLYDRIRALTRRHASPPAPISTISATTAPACAAAAEHDVVHPFVEAGIDKAAVCALAARSASTTSPSCRPSRASRAASRPASPSMPTTSRFVDAVERALAAQLRAKARRSAAASRMPASSSSLAATLPQARDDRRDASAQRLRARHGRAFAGVRAYRRGAAFLRDRRDG